MTRRSKREIEKEIHNLTNDESSEYHLQGDLLVSWRDDYDEDELDDHLVIDFTDIDT